MCRRLCSVCPHLEVLVYALPKTVRMRSGVFNHVDTMKLLYVHFQGSLVCTVDCVRYLYTRKQQFICFLGGYKIIL